MRDYSRGYVPRTDIADRSDHHAELTRQLEVSDIRICEYEYRLHKYAATMKPIELDRLLDDYRAEQVRYDRLSRELQTLEEPKKTGKYRDYHRTKNQQNRDKIKY